MCANIGNEEDDARKKLPEKDRVHRGALRNARRNTTNRGKEYAHTRCR